MRTWLRICVDAPDMTKPRPSGFAAPAAPGYISSLVFTREKVAPPGEAMNGRGEGVCCFR
jgi:hypothetical protein